MSNRVCKMLIPSRVHAHSSCSRHFVRGAAYVGTAAAGGEYAKIYLT